jgi:hypothetical protein
MPDSPIDHLITNGEKIPVGQDNVTEEDELEDSKFDGVRIGNNGR